LTGIDNSRWPQSVVVNDNGPIGAAWGPLEGLEGIPALAYPIGDEIKFTSPSRSVQFVLTDSGSRIISSVEEKISQTVGQFNLYQNYPNPFNPRTTISYSLPRASTITLKVYDVLGRDVATLVDNETKGAGNHEVSFNASNLPSGVYFYRLQAENHIETKSMVLIK
jgi:hypothetical protein